MWQKLPVERLKPTLAFFLSALLIASLMSFTYEGKTVSSNKKGKKDSAASVSSKGFNSLLINYDPSDSYNFQLNPKAISFVEDYIAENRYDLEKMRVWGKPYFEIYDSILSKYHLPVELKYLSVVESNLSSGLVSRAGAVGPWQLMSYEARRFGLRTGKRDQRKDFKLSTKVAAKLLRELYNQFGDWLLVIAAYNCGAGRMRLAIKKAGTDDFWELEKYLPLQTRNHVKKFIATHYLFEGGGGWTTMSARETALHQQNLASLLNENETDQPVAVAIQEDKAENSEGEITISK